jgi:transcriptional regulator with XRE-family HTH domain
MTRLRFHRLERGLTQSALATVVGLNRVTLSQIEIGRVNPTTAELARLSDVLGIPADRLLDPVTDPDELIPLAQLAAIDVLAEVTR